MAYRVNEAWLLALKISVYSVGPVWKFKLTPGASDTAVPLNTNCGQKTRAARVIRQQPRETGVLTKGSG